MASTRASVVEQRLIHKIKNRLFRLGIRAAIQRDANRLADIRLARSPHGIEQLVDPLPGSSSGNASRMDLPTTDRPPTTSR